VTMDVKRMYMFRKKRVRIVQNIWEEKAECERNAETVLNLGKLCNVKNTRRCDKPAHNI
jgi:hypothetical protein